MEKARVTVKYRRNKITSFSYGCRLHAAHCFFIISFLVHHTHTHIHIHTHHTINHSVGHTHRHSTIAYHHTLRTYLIMFQYGGAVRLIGG
jgi:hypothetical protein